MHDRLKIVLAGCKDGGAGKFLEIVVLPGLNSVLVHDDEIVAVRPLVLVLQSQGMAQLMDDHGHTAIGQQLNELFAPLAPGVRMTSILSVPEMDVILLGVARNKPNASDILPSGHGLHDPLW